MPMLQSSVRRFFLGGITFAAYELCVSSDGENFRLHAEQLWQNLSISATIKAWDAEHIAERVEAAWDAKLIQLVILAVLFKVMATLFRWRVEKSELIEGEATPALAAAAAAPAATRAARKKKR